LYCTAASGPHGFPSQPAGPGSTSTVSRQPAAAAGRSSPRTGPGPRPGRESCPPRARAVNRTVGPLAASPTCRRCRQSGRRGPAAWLESRQTPVARQAWGTDSDTSRRRSGRRFHRDPGPPVPRTATPRRLRSVHDLFICGPRLSVCLDVACPSCLHLPPFPSAPCKARDTFTPVQYTGRDTDLQCDIACGCRSLQLVVFQSLVVAFPCGICSSLVA
jgi:hypothetical protein